MKLPFHLSLSFSAVKSVVSFLCGATPPKEPELDEGKLFEEATPKISPINVVERPEGPPTGE